MRNIFRLTALALVLTVLAAAPSFGLSDAEYKKMLKNSDFAKADRMLTNAWNKAKKSFPDTEAGKAASKLLLEDQREWIKNGRDADVQDLMGMEGYSKLKAYTEATKSRAEYLPNLARECLERAQSETPKKKPAPKNEAPKKEPKKDPPKKEIAGYPTETLRRIAAGDWTDNYPDTGSCIGNGVRVREDPDTGADNILGKLNEGETVMIVGETSVDDEKWYEIDNPYGDGTAFVSANYIETYKGYEVDTPAYETLMQIFLNFGLTPGKTRILLGKPDREMEDNPFYEPANRKIHQDIFQYFNGIDLRYNDGKLSYVRVYEEGAGAFGEINLGDSASKLTEVFGQPFETEGGMRKYEATPRYILTFVSNDKGKIVEMLLEEYID